MTAALGVARQLHRWHECRTLTNGGSGTTPGPVEDVGAAKGARQDPAVPLALRTCHGDHDAMLRLRQLLWSVADRDLRRLDDAAVLIRVGDLVRTGLLCTCARTAIKAAETSTPTVRRHLAPEPVAPPPTTRRRPPERTVEKKTWLQIEMLGEDDKPVGGVRYSVTLPDGSVRSGKLDAKGRARFEDLDPGQAIVSFPDLDRDAWESI